MASAIKIYKIKDFIRKNESGEIDFDKSIRMVHELSIAAAYHTNHNILVDLRETKTSIERMDEVMKIVMEFVRMRPYFKNKIANVIPNDENRFASAKQFETFMNLKNFQYKFFTEFEHAIEWLSDVNT